MSNVDMIKKLQELQELKRLAEELNAEIETVSDELKAAMGETEVATFGPYKVTYKYVTSSRVDTSALKKAFPAEALAPFIKVSTSRPFKVT